VDVGLSKALTGDLLPCSASGNACGLNVSTAVLLARLRC
jgi:hypothetical protein